MRTEYWEREMDVKSFMVMAFQNISFRKYLMKLQEKLNYGSKQRVSLTQQDICFNNLRVYLNWIKKITESL